MISKKVNNTGKAGGHSTQIITLDHLQDSEVYNDYLKGHLVGCSHCGESYRLKPDHSFTDALKLELVLKADGCPFCNNKGSLTETYLEWFMINKKKVLEFSFQIALNVFVDVVRKPNGWKPLTQSEIEEGQEMYLSK